MDKLDLILEKIEAVDKKVDVLGNKVEQLDRKVEQLDQKVEQLDQRVEALEGDVKEIKLTLENEVRTNIMRVAEGHLDLFRHLKEATKSNNEYEMLTVRVNMLETDVRELKRKIS